VGAQRKFELENGPPLIQFASDATGPSVDVDAYATAFCGLDLYV